jgi:2-aminoethylphosphonate-pyruvate transaminase
VIYPGKVTNADCFRIGHIGQIYPDDITALLEAIRVTLAEMNVPIIKD